MDTHLDLELSAYLDGELSGADLARVETHLGACEECRSALEDLRRLVRRAGALDDRAPERDLWAGIADRIRGTPAATTDVVPIERARRRRISFTMPQLAAASLALVALSAGVALRFSGAPGAPPASASGILPAVSATRISLPSDRAVVSYDSAITSLATLLETRRAQLDTSTARVIEQSLALIDLAIEQASTALAAEPNNMLLNRNLQHALDSKLRLLRQVATLPIS
jgi:anti-sigma factor RsiW